MRPLTEIIIHCTATRPDWWAQRSTADKVAEVKRWHVEERGWKDIGYHFLIDRNGYTVTGRPLDQIGAHTVGKNIGTIGISLFGGHGSAANDKFAGHFTPDQDKSLRALLERLIKEYPSIKMVSGHNQYASKACPGFNVPSWYASARPKPAPVASKVGIFAALSAFFRR